MMNFENILNTATAKIESGYFQLPIAGQENPIYRERVYCYELYHQIRSCWPNEIEYVLSGEVDKAGHPLVRGNGLNNIKPDFLVHVPGDMGGNHTIVEVKPINADSQGIIKDLITLTKFRQFAGYEHAIFLLYGQGNFNRVLNCINNNENENINLDLIEFWWHENVGQSASKVDINN